jgi:hypothetical protein
MKEPGNSVDIVLRLGAGRFGVRFTAGAKTFSLLRNVQTACVAHPASCAVGTGRSFLEVKLPAREADH